MIAINKGPFNFDQFLSGVPAATTHENIVARHAKSPKPIPGMPEGAVTAQVWVNQDRRWSNGFLWIRPDGTGEWDGLSYRLVYMVEIIPTIPELMDRITALQRRVAELERWLPNIKEPCPEQPETPRIYDPITVGDGPPLVPVVTCEDRYGAKAALPESRVLETLPTDGPGVAGYGHWLRSDGGGEHFTDNDFADGV